ncbi:hypothetical protein GBA52_020459 [Prunus armeniaca]|nr:hypothetical protein GBA52_020459 [Prunus armeniaca]
MATVNVDNMLTRLRHKRAIVKRRKIIVCTMISFMVTIVQWYYDNFRIKEPSHNWDEERRSYLNHKYYLVDAGYTNGPGFLAPYRGTKYHLSEWNGNNRPENYKELFNLRHSIARNVVERGFGLLKKRWSILRTPSFFNIKTQVRIINACFVLHNFIRTEPANDPVLEVPDLV